MAFSVLKDPSDPRNFIVGPDPTRQLDPNLIQQGLAAGAAQGLPGNRPAPRQFGGGREGTEGTQETDVQSGRFGGPGDPRQFKRGLINLHGRLLKKTFEQNKAAMMEDFARAGGVVTPEVTRQVDNALKSTGGFDAARDALSDFRDAQPDRVAQRDVDLQAITEAATRKANNERLTNDKLRSEREVFGVTRGVPMEKFVSDKQDFNTNLRLADRVRDLQTLNERIGVMRGPTFTDADRAAVQQAYEDATLELTIAVSQANQAGALSDAEFKRFERFLPDFSSTAPVQDSTRRVTLGNAFNIFKGSANDLVAGNRGLQKGTEAVNFDRDIGKAKTFDQILFKAGGQPGDIDVTGRVAEARAERDQLQTRATAATESIPSVADITGGPSILFPGGAGTTGREEVEKIKEIGSDIADFLLPAAGGR